MAETLYLIETRARGLYFCSACKRHIQVGTTYFRHDPHPSARRYRDQKTSHWCRECILASDPGPKEYVTGRIRVPALRVLGMSPNLQRPEPTLLEPLRIEVVGLGSLLSRQLADDPLLVHSLSAGEFEEFVCDRLYAMGLEPKRVGSTQRKDGGIDVVFWPRAAGAFPFLGAAQIKHHRDPQRKEGPGSVRDFAGAIAGHGFNAGMLVSNTSFTPDAQWFARERAKLLRLRDFSDVRRWLLDNFSDEAEWRELPSSIELCPGVVVKIR
jgi:hypothetical protein